MGLFVDTVSANVSLPDLGITLVHPTTDFDIGGKFDARLIAESTDLFAAITGNQLNWKKTSGGLILVNADYDADVALADEGNLGTGFQGDRIVTFKDLTAENLTGASPGFTFGRSGSIADDTWLQNETVPSNITGRRIPIDNAFIARVWVDNENVATYSVEVWQHEGNEVNLTLKATANVVAARGITVDPNVTVDSGKQLAMKVTTSGTAKNVVGGIIVKGDT